MEGLSLCVCESDHYNQPFISWVIYARLSEGGLRLVERKSTELPVESHKWRPSLVFLAVGLAVGQKRAFLAFLFKFTY